MTEALWGQDPVEVGAERGGGSILQKRILSEILAFGRAARKTTNLAPCLGLVAQHNLIEGVLVALCNGQHEFLVRLHLHTIHFLLIFRRLSANNTAQKAASTPKSTSSGRCGER